VLLADSNKAKTAPKARPKRSASRAGSPAGASAPTGGPSLSQQSSILEASEGDVFGEGLRDEEPHESSDVSSETPLARVALRATDDQWPQGAEGSVELSDEDADLEEAMAASLLDFPSAAAALEEKQMQEALVASAAENQDRAEQLRAARAAIDPDGTRLIPVLADGNCFYRAMALGMGLPEKYFHAVKTSCLAAFRDLFDAGLISEQWKSFDGDVEAYLAKLAERDAYADLGMILAAAAANNAHIHVHMPGQPAMVVDDKVVPTNGSRMIHLAYVGWNHYDFIVRP